MQPTKCFRDKGLSVSHWQADDKGQQAPKITFQKRFKDTEGNWRQTSTLYVSEIPRAVSLLQQAHDYLLEEYPAQTENAE